MVTPTVKTGVGRYIDGLLLGLSECPMCECDYIVFAGRNQTSLPELPPDRFKVVRAPVSTDDSVRTLLWKLLVLPRLLSQESVDVLHVLNEKLLLWRSTATVMTIHDIADYRHRNRCSWARRLYRQAMLPLAVKKVDHLIAVSETTKQDVVELLGVHPDRISVTHEGVGNHFHPQNTEDARAVVASRWGMSQEFVLFVGEIDIRKNLGALVRAMDIVIHTHNRCIGLIVAGKRGRGTEALTDEIARLDLARSVVVTGYVPERDLVALYNAASAVVLPSWYEGFGLPAIESMACGTPVIASRSGALCEVVGDAGLLVDVDDSDELVRAILAVLSDTELRRRLISRGLSRAGEFTWSRSAGATRVVYCSVARAARGEVCTGL